MMRPFISTVALVSFLSYATALCSEDEHHPENGGYFFVGAAGVSSDLNLDSVHGQKLPNATWAIGIDYPYGQKEVCSPDGEGDCSEECGKEPGCPQFLNSHTCSILRFCPPTGATSPQAVFLLPDFAATEACDFSFATEIGSTLQSSDGCLEYVFEEDHELTEYYFASTEGCDQGQRLAVSIKDFSMTADQCKAIGRSTPRIRNCDCRLQIKPSTLGEPCRTAFSDACQAVVQEGDCCATSTCLSIFEDWNHPAGRKQELERRAACDDSIPGLCYNEDGVGTDTNRMGSTNCCTNTCTGCGIEDNPFAQWKPCTSFDTSSHTAKCGFLSRYDRAPFECDFSKCATDTHWVVGGEALTSFASENKRRDSGEGETSAADPRGGLIVLLGLALIF